MGPPKNFPVKEDDLNLDDDIKIGTDGLTDDLDLKQASPMPSEAANHKKCE